MKAVKDLVRKAVGENISENTTNGDVFQAARHLQDASAIQGYQVVNILDVYNWILEIRDEKKKLGTNRKGIHNKG